MSERDPGMGMNIEEKVGRITRENARLLQRLTETERRFHRISRGVLRLQEEERSRISRDLHDGVGQSLTALKIQLELLERDLEAAGGNLAERTAAARSLAETCLAEVRQLSHLLRPQMLDELGLVPTLRWLARTVEQRTGLEVILEWEGSEASMDTGAETVVFRVVQEALNNVVKHAGTSSARVRVSRGERAVRVEVTDTGSGFSAEEVLSGGDEDRGFGVRAMRDRVQSFGGRFTVRSAPGSGTVVEAEIPLDETGDAR